MITCFKYGFRLLVVALTLFLCHATGLADGISIKSTDQGNVVFIPELGALVMQDGEDLKVEMIPPPEQRSVDYRKVDLRKGDIILMCNGKKVKETGDLETLIESVEIGENIKFGIRREGGMMIVDYPKGDPETMPKGQVMVMKSTVGDDQGASETGGPQVIGVGGPEGLGLYPELGLILKEEEDGLVVQGILPQAEEVFGDNGPQEGDIVVKIQDQSPATTGDFDQAFADIPVGATVRLVLSRDGSESVFTCVKPESKPQRMMIINSDKKKSHVQ